MSDSHRRRTTERGPAGWALGVEGMARPRFLLVAGTPATRKAWLWWLDTSRPDEQDGSAGPGGGDWVSWRLAGGNNRELGRSADVHESVAACVRAATRLQSAVGDVLQIVGLHELTGLWGWRLDLDDRPVAAAARLYPRRREATYSVTQFLEAVPLAVVAGNVVRIGRSGRSRPARPGPVAGGTEAATFTAHVSGVHGRVPAGRPGAESVAPATAPVRSGCAGPTGTGGAPRG